MKHTPASDDAGALRGDGAALFHERGPSASRAAPRREPQAGLAPPGCAPPSAARIEIAVENPLRIADFVPCSNVLDELIRLQDVRADLTAPTDVGFIIFHRLFFSVALLHFLLVHFCTQHFVCFIAVSMLRALYLAYDHNPGRLVR